MNAIRLARACAGCYRSRIREAMPDIETVAGPKLVSIDESPPPHMLFTAAGRHRPFRSHVGAGG
jgi:hypothetical protein